MKEGLTWYQSRQRLGSKVHKDSVINQPRSLVEDWKIAETEEKRDEYRTDRYADSVQYFDADDLWP